MNLNLCSGPFPMRGFVNADMVPYLGTNVVCDARALPFKDNSFNGVTFIHAIEHFTHDEAQDILKDIWRVLKPLGMIHVEGPDIEKISTNYVHDRRLVEFIFGNLEEIRRDPLYTHKWGYTGYTVGKELVKAGFKNLDILEDGLAHGFPNRDYKVTGVKHGG